MPVVSFFDPDRLIARRTLGIAAADLGEMKTALASLLADDARRLDMGARAKTYTMENYAASAVARRYVELFAQNFSSEAGRRRTEVRSEVREGARSA